jgi:hypothetical protein
MEEFVKLILFVMNSNSGHGYSLMRGGKKGKFTCAALGIDIEVPYKAYERAYLIREATEFAMSADIKEVLEFKHKLVMRGVDDVMSKVLSKPSKKK